MKNWRFLTKMKNLLKMKPPFSMIYRFGRFYLSDGAHVVLAVSVAITMFTRMVRLLSAANNNCQYFMWHGKREIVWSHNEKCLNLMRAELPKWMCLNDHVCTRTRPDVIIWIWRDFAYGLEDEMARKKKWKWIWKADIIVLQIAITWNPSCRSMRARIIFALLFICASMKETKSTHEIVCFASA